MEQYTVEELKSFKEALVASAILSADYALTLHKWIERVDEAIKDKEFDAEYMGNNY